MQRIAFSSYFQPLQLFSRMVGCTGASLLDRDNDTLAFEFITDDDWQKALPPPKKPKTEESV